METLKVIFFEFYIFLENLLGVKKAIKGIRARAAAGY